mmetsp:Transcript_14143/g.35266  ORF Transcript_14143/g.35266 Transcript_14143/m.35266 type:complete len:363 (+) Transcript_14143:2506-3594(+)
MVCSWVCSSIDKIEPATSWTDTCLNWNEGSPGLECCKSTDRKSASCKFLRMPRIVDPGGSSRLPFSSMGSSCFWLKCPIGESTAATLRMSCSPTGSRSIRDVIRVSTDDGHSILPMSQPAARLTSSALVLSTPCSSIDCMNPLAKKGLPPDLVVTAEERASCTRPETHRNDRISSSMSARVRSESFSYSDLIALSSGASSFTGCGRVVRTTNMGCTRSMASASNCQDEASIQWTSSNITSMREPPNFAWRTWHITLIACSLRASPESCFVNSLSAILIGSTGLRSGACCSISSLCKSSSSTCGLMTQVCPFCTEPGHWYASTVVMAFFQRCRDLDTGSCIPGVSGDVSVILARRSANLEEPS